LSGSTNEKCRLIVSRIGKDFSLDSYTPTPKFGEYQNLLHSHEAPSGATKENLQFKLPSLCEVALYAGFTALIGLLLMVPGAQEEEAAMIAARAAGSGVLHSVQSEVAAWLLENAAVVVTRLASLIGVSGSVAANMLAGVLGLDAGPAISAICG
jgi:hypothetical protein